MKRLDRTQTKLTTLEDADEDSSSEYMSVAERIEMVSEVSVTAFAFAGKDASSRLLRHVASVVRPAR